jgi:hypothetical protein
MAGLKFLLERRVERRRRSRLLSFTQGLSLYLQVGYDLHYSWQKMMEVRGLEMEDCLRLDVSEGIATRLGILSEEYPAEEHRLWFSVLSDLYRAGGGLAPAVLAISTHLRREQERDLEAHCQTLPTRMNVVLILFFLPPTLLLLFYPLVAEILTLF